MTASDNPGHGTKWGYQGLRIKAWRVNIAKISYPGRSPETANFAILAIMTPLDEPVVP